MIIMFTQSTAILHKYLNDKLKILCFLQFFPEVAQNSPRIPWVFHVQKNSWLFQVFQVGGHPEQVANMSVDPVSRQLTIINLAAGCHYFPPDPWLPSRHTASLTCSQYQIILLGDRSMCANKLPSIVTWQWNGQTVSRKLKVGSNSRHRCPSECPKNSVKTQKSLSKGAQKTDKFDHSVEFINTTIDKIWSSHTWWKQVQRHYSYGYYDCCLTMVDVYMVTKSPSGARKLGEADSWTRWATVRIVHSNTTDTEAAEQIQLT